MRCVQRLENFLAETLWYYDPIVQHYYIVNDIDQVVKICW